MTSDDILALAAIFADSEGVKHWSISMKIFGKGDVFHRLENGANCYPSTIQRAERWFAENWPDDLAWPEEIERPAKQVERKEEV